MAKQTRTALGHIKDQPLRYINGHHARGTKRAKPRGICSVGGCERETRSSGSEWCEMHYYRRRRHDDPLVSLGEGRRDQHGHARQRTRTYRTWMAMRRRCTDPTNIGWERYGGRGIKVCARWPG